MTPERSRCNLKGQVEDNGFAKETERELSRWKENQECLAL
jgi:hypothetical protein